MLVGGHIIIVIMIIIKSHLGLGKVARAFEFAGGAGRSRRRRPSEQGGKNNLAKDDERALSNRARGGGAERTSQRHDKTPLPNHRMRRTPPPAAAACPMKCGRGFPETRTDARKAAPLPPGIENAHIQGYNQGGRRARARQALHSR